MMIILQDNIIVEIAVFNYTGLTLNILLCVNATLTPCVLDLFTKRLWLGLSISSSVRLFVHSPGSISYPLDQMQSNFTHVFLTIICRVRLNALSQRNGLNEKKQNFLWLRNLFQRNSLLNFVMRFM